MIKYLCHSVCHSVTVPSMTFYAILYSCYVLENELSHRESQPPRPEPLGAVQDARQRLAGRPWAYGPSW